jgi:hypothetical protein
MYMNDLSWITHSANNYRATAITTYKMIDSLLDVRRTAYPDHLQETGPFIKDFEGKYTNRNVEIDITIENGLLYLKDNKEVTQCLWHDNDDYYAVGINPILRFTRNKKGQRVIEARSNGISFLAVKKE